MILIIQNATDMILLKTFIALSFILVAEHATFIALCRLRKLKIYIFLVVIHLFFPLAFAECDDSLPFSGFSSIPLYYTLFSCHPSPPTILPSSHTSSCHLFLGLPLSLAVPKFIYNTLLGILFPSTLYIPKPMKYI